MNNTRAAGPEPGPGTRSGRTLWIHIGGAKTGTTALQHFFSINRQVLMMRGYLYPGRRESHWGIATELDLLHEGGVFPGMPHQLNALLDEITGSLCPHSIISAEDLAGTGGAATLRSLVPDTITVKIIYYARRQDDLIESRYNEFVKNPIYRLKECLDEKLVDSCYQRRDFDHLKVIEQWAGAFGKDNVIVRCYEKNQLHGGGIIEDFTGIIGISPDNSMKMPHERVNKSLDIHHTEFIRLCNAHFQDMPEINDFLYRKLFNGSQAMSQLPGRHRLSPETRIGILDHYEESNRQFARDYLGREDGHLFYAPRPDPSEPWEPFQGLTVEDLVPLFTEMIYAIDMRQKQELQKHELQPLTACLEIVNYFLKKFMAIIPRGIKQYVQEKTDRWYNRG